jgi:nitrite reductase (NADH) small subunit/3-phenylpropionate/trans-cinnamate dioxygenase ferredoxin subunit
MAWTSLCNLDELTEAQGKFVQIDGFSLAVFLDGGNVHVLDNTCPHAGGPLAEGIVQAGNCVCPWHGWEFNLETGESPDALGAAVTHYKSRLLSRDGQPTLVQADLPMP